MRDYVPHGQGLWRVLPDRESVGGHRRTLDAADSAEHPPALSLLSEIQQGCPHISSTLLAQRLRSLERDRVIQRVAAPSGRGSRYYLTPAGQELAEVVLQLGTWGARWLDLGPRDYEPDLVLWAWAKFLDRDKLPPRRVVVWFDLTDRPREQYWMLVDGQESELCVKSPGFDEDIVVTTDSITLTNVHRGRLTFGLALSTGRLQIDGLPEFVGAFPSWGGLSPFAEVRPAHSA